jgi:8-oxo-dGTP pyrophosphatase MutT (NUDIX family)
MEVSDASPAHCAARELEEELAVRAEPGDFTILACRGRREGQLATLLLYGPPLGWCDIVIGEGAGAGFFWKRELLQLSLAPPVLQHLERHPQFFADRPAEG